MPPLAPTTATFMSLAKDSSKDIFRLRNRGGCTDSKTVAGMKLGLVAAVCQDVSVRNMLKNSAAAQPLTAAPSHHELGRITESMT